LARTFLVAGARRVVPGCRGGGAPLRDDNSFSRVVGSGGVMKRWRHSWLKLAGNADGVQSVMARVGTTWCYKWMAATTMTQQRDSGANRACSGPNLGLIGLVIVSEQRPPQVVEGGSPPIGCSAA
jgi:hypothetical protein